MHEDPRIVGIISEKDKDSIITNCNEVFLFYAGIKSYDKILGYSDIDFPWQNYADIYRAHELDALAGNNYSTIYPLKDYNGDDRLFLHTKIQKTNPDGSLGIKCRAIEIINVDLTKLVQCLSKKLPGFQKQFTIGKQRISHKHLSDRQLEVLFLLIRGKTAKQIAQIFGLSPRTVEKYIEVIKDKFNCHNKNELIEYSIDNGYLEMIPEYLLKSVKNDKHYKNNLLAKMHDTLSE